VHVRLRHERGIALPVALAVLLVVAALALVAARAAVTSNNQSFRDGNVKRAVQAAGAGLQAVVYQTNLLQPDEDECVVRDPGSGALSVAAIGADGWCRPLTEDLGDGVTFSAQISSASALSANGQNLVERRIVSTGTTNGVSRRAELTVRASTGAPLFPFGYALASDASLTIDNNAVIDGGVASNGDITVRNNAEVCGPATPGPGRTVSLGHGATVCGSTDPASQPFVFQPVDQGNARTVNDNVRITRAKSGSGSPRDSCSNCNRVEWDESTRVLRLGNNATLTLTGDVYSICRIELSNGAALQVAVRSTPLKVFVDSPENCGGGAGMGSVAFGNGSQVSNFNTSPTTFQLLVAGSPAIPTSVDLANNSGSGDSDSVIAIYAPNSDVELRNNVRITGAVLGKSMTVSNNVRVTWDDRAGDIASDSPARLYERQNYKECTSAPTGSAPDSGC
jgi:type II secretory pathway pseudopilin PulG